MKKDTVLHVRITGKQKEKIEAEAKKQNVKVPQYVIEALDFYAGFDVHFLECMYSTAEKMKLPMPTVIEHLLQSYLSTDGARAEVFGTGGKAYRRAFQYDDQD